ncbi:MAG: hypothetical protein DRG20_04400 [Deltaproteobacteria bacterium]|nr:MAG: hypothetical protein DRG20_04400 [Deltaproteobacteria bacterium]
MAFDDNNFFPMIRIGERASGRYRILSELGKGPQGKTFLARDLQTQKEVAIKFFRKDLFTEKKDLNRFFKRVKSLYSLNDPHLVKVLDCGEYKGFPFVVSEFIPAANLAEVIFEKRKEGKAFDLREAGLLILQIVQGIISLHFHNIHGNLKPENIIITEDNKAIVTDPWGTEFIPPEILMGEGLLSPLESYMAPERKIGRFIDVRSDIYSIGVIFFEMIGGDASKGILTPMGEISLDVPEILKGIIKRSVAIDPDDRYPNGSYLLDDLRTYLQGKTPYFESFVTKKRKTHPQKAFPEDLGDVNDIEWKPVKKRKSGWIILILILLFTFLLSAFGGYYYFKRKERIEIAKKGITPVPQEKVTPVPPEVKRPKIPETKSTILPKEKKATTSKGKTKGLPQVKTPTTLKPKVSLVPKEKPSVTLKPKITIIPKKTTSILPEVAKKPPEKKKAPPKKTTTIVITQLDIRSNPPGAKIIIDGKEKGETPFSLTISPGEHNVIIKKDGYSTWKKNIEIKKGESKKLVAYLKARYGSLYLDTIPSNADIYINGKKAGKTPLELKKIKPGKYLIKIKKERYYEQEVPINIIAGRRVKKQIKLKGGNLVFFRNRWMTLEEKESILKKEKEKAKKEAEIKEAQKRKAKIRKLLAYAQKNISKGKYDEAIRDLNGVLALEPENQKALRLIKKARKARREKMLRKIKIANRLSAGIDFMDKGKYEDAIKEFDAVLKLDPENEKAKEYRLKAKIALLELKRGIRKKPEKEAKLIKPIKPLKTEKPKPSTSIAPKVKKEASVKPKLIEKTGFDILIFPYNPSSGGIATIYLDGERVTSLKGDLLQKLLFIGTQPGAHELKVKCVGVGERGLMQASARQKFFLRPGEVITVKLEWNNNKGILKFID